MSWFLPLSRILKLGVRRSPKVHPEPKSEYELWRISELQPPAYSDESDSSDPDESGPDESDSIWSESRTLYLNIQQPFVLESIYCGDRDLILTNCIGAKQITTTEELGKGTSNSVYGIEGIDGKDDNDKILRISTENLDGELNGYEIQIRLSSIKNAMSAGICKVFEYGKLVQYNRSGQKLEPQLNYGYCIMQKIQTTFLEYIDKNKDKGADFYKPKIKSLLKVLEFMHESRYGHFDIKPENIGLIGDTILLFDFGYSLPLQLGSQTPFFAGTNGYMGPELYQYEKSDANGKTDIFAVGMIIINDMFKGRYNAGVEGYIKLCKSRENKSESNELMEPVNYSMMDFLNIKKEDLPKDLFDFLSGLTCFNIENRFSAEQALTSLWITPASAEAPPAAPAPPAPEAPAEAPPAPPAPPAALAALATAVFGPTGGKRKSRKILKNKSKKNKSKKNKRSYKSSKKSSKKSKRKRSSKSQKYTK
jgi:serine/threonine protein kinase